MQINASFNNNASFCLLSASFANFHFWKFSCLSYQAGVQSRFARGQREFCAPLIRCSFVLPRCNTGTSGNAVQRYSFSQNRRGTCLSPAAALCQGSSLAAESTELLAVVTGRNSPGLLRTLLPQRAIVLDITVIPVETFMYPLRGNQNSPTTEPPLCT